LNSLLDKDIIDRSKLFQMSESNVLIQCDHIWHNLFLWKTQRLRTQSKNIVTRFRIFQPEWRV